MIALALACLLAASDHWPAITCAEAVCYVESRFDPTAYNEIEQAAGEAQIRPILVADLNRIAGYERWALADRWCPAKSRLMFWEYTGYWIRRRGLADTAENRSKIWNGGPRGHLKQSTATYWQAVKERMEQ